MKIELWVTGSSKKKEFQKIEVFYLKRIQAFTSFAINVFPEFKSKSNSNNKETEQLLKSLKNNDTLVLLDEKGKMLASKQFANFLQKQMTYSPGRIIFLIGGPYGFDKSLYGKADHLLSLSKMTFTHDMVRIFFIEQLYRAFTILRNMPYHH